MNVPLEPSELLTLPSEVPTLPPEPQFTPSVAPEALKRPYASLVPQKKEDTPVTSIPAAAPLPNLEAKAPAGPSKAPSSSSKAPARSSRSGARPVCKKHKIAHGKDGRCLLCVKDAETSGGAGWKVFIALGVLSVLVGGVVALLTP